MYGQFMCVCGCMDTLCVCVKAEAPLPYDEEEGTNIAIQTRMDDRL